MNNEIIDAREMFVVKANTLVQKSRFSLSLQQQKIILYLISKIRPEDEEFKEYEFSIVDFCKTVGIDFDNGGNYKELKTHILALRNSAVWVTNGKGEEVTLAWIEKASINKRCGIIRIRLDSDMKPFLLQLKEHYTQYQLIYTLRMKSKYSLRLYELVMSFLYNKTDTYSKCFTVEELRKLLDAEKYTRFCHFHEKVIKLAVEEINQYTDLNLTYRQIQNGKKTVAIEFTFSTKGTLGCLRIVDEANKELDGYLL